MSFERGLSTMGKEEFPWKSAGIVRFLTLQDAPEEQYVFIKRVDKRRRKM
jgi:hypothetical protein